jgi:predicted RNA binding protein YcfA (HicA-like mRNA interferase family)
VLSKVGYGKATRRQPRQVIRFLEQNGFVLDHTSGSHFIFYHQSTRRRAVVPSHNRDLPKGTLMSLLREAGFTREELIDFLAGR